MKRILSGLLAVAAISAPAMAADMAPAPVYSKAPAVVVQAYSWTGCYVGVNGGYAWNRTRAQYTDDPNVGPDPIRAGTTFQNSLATAVPVPTDPSSKGGFGGGQVGCNWQTGQFVVGVEADAVGMNLAGTATSAGITPTQFVVSANGGFTTFGTAAGTAIEQVTQRWLATFRARAGFTVSDRVLVYVTGGLAEGGITSTGTVSITQANGNAFTWTGTTSTNRAGYAVGAGVEWAFADSWSLKGEYLYYDLGRVSHALNVSACSGGGCFATLGNTTTRINDNMVRVGLNYHFNTPVVAKY